MSEIELGELDPGILINAFDVSVPLTRATTEQIVDGSPSTGSVDLDEDMGIGVWEMTVGAMRDVEIDEVFVVIAGDATLEFVSPALPPVSLRPGSIMRLTSGMQTVWTVRSTLRKVYLA